jgi:hypothetical protein
MDLKLRSNWQQLMDQYRKSGLTKTDFCRSQRIPVYTFFYYQKLHRSTLPEVPQKTSQLFIPLVEKKDFTIRINNSISLSFEAAPDAAWMAKFVMALGDTHARP